MKKYFVLTYESKNNEHLNVQDLLPASCHLITGIAVNAIAKQEVELQNIQDKLSFPQELISKLLKSESISKLFYSYLRTRSTEAVSRAFFEESIFPEIVQVLSSNIKYSCLDEQEQQVLSDRITALFYAQFVDFIFEEAGLFKVGQGMNNLALADFIAQQTRLFTYRHRHEIFHRSIEVYKQTPPYECGSISLLVNGNSFLLCDYILSANRKVKQMSKELIPFHEPLEVNSNIHTVFKSNKNSDNQTLTIRIYIEYETSQ